LGRRSKRSRMEKFSLVVDGFALAAVMAVLICVKPKP
jgi:hypothetical protein